METQPGIKRPGVGSARRGVRNSIRNPCDAFPARGRRKTIVGYRRRGPPKKEKGKINGASTPSRRVDRDEREGGEGSCEIETKGARARIDPIRAIYPRSEPRRGGDASSIVTNCLVKEGPYVYKDRPPPPSPFIPPLSSRACRGSPGLEAQHSSVTTDDRPEFDRFSFGNL